MRAAPVFAPKASHAMVVIAGMFTSCGSGLPAERPEPRNVLHERFESADELTTAWSATPLLPPGAAIWIRGEEIQLTSPNAGLALRRSLDPVQLRGQRIRITAMVRTNRNDVKALATFRYGTLTSPAHDQAVTELVSSQAVSRVEMVADIASDASQPELALVLQTGGIAWFSNIVVESLGPVPRSPTVQLSPRQLTSLEIVAQLAALVRYRHPSDQAAAMDWDVFLPGAIERVLQASSREALLAQLRAMFAPFAPTLELSTSPRRTTGALPRGGGTHLARWQRYGLGSDTYVQWREGRDPDLASLWSSTIIQVPDLKTCKAAQLRAKVHRGAGGGKVTIAADVAQPELASKQFEHKVLTTDDEIEIQFEMPSDAYRVSLVISVEGDVSLTMQDASFGCGQPLHSIDLATWEDIGTSAMYAHRIVAHDGHPGVQIQRLAVATEVGAADALDTDLGDGIWAHLPLAVWSDGAKTYPVSAPSAMPPRYAPTDLAVRLAAVASAWGTVWTFFPYFADTHVDWRAALPMGYAQAAAARTLPEIRNALLMMLAKLRDNHVRVSHPAVSLDGVLPIKLRRFGNQVFVIGTLSEYAEQVPVGAELLAIDQDSAIHAYDALTPIVPVSTENWANYIVPYWLTLGVPGGFSRVRLKTPTGEIRELALPHVARDAYDAGLRKLRPASERELEPGVFYIAADQLQPASIDALLPSLSRARAVIFDMRAYPDTSAFTLLAHFADRPMQSPRFQVPHIGAASFETRQWDVRPATPRLRASLFVLIDGRAVSRAETVLQIVHDNHIGTLVGEPSAGTNGDAEYTTLPGGFTLRFTGSRALFPDGSLVQGHGIPPDVAVQPTAAAMRAGRDEILEEALRRARAVP